MQKFWLFILIICLSSCTHDDFLSEQSQLVVEGWIENDGYPVVFVTKTMPVSLEERNVNDLEDYLVRWARVSIVCNEDTVVLTGKYDKKYFPPFIYTTGQMKGKVGETYKLLVEYDEMKASATTTISSVPIVDSIKVEKCIDVDSLYQISACMSIDGNVDNYYQFFSRVGTSNRQFYASFLGCIDESAYTSNYEVPVYRGNQNISLEDYTPYFHRNDTVAIKCCHLDLIEYRFWKTYMESRNLSGAAMLATTNNLPTNINGGAGYWFGYGSTTAYIIIKDYAQ